MAITRAGKKRAVQAIQHQTPGSTYCPLLNLPGELRNMIYEHLLENKDYRNPIRIAISLKAPNGLSSDCGLVRANKQLREEFLSLLPYAAQVIRTVVHNFDFVHVRKFLRGLSNKHLRAMYARGSNISFDLSFTSETPASRRQQMSRLNKWLGFVGKLLCFYNAKSRSDQTSIAFWIEELCLSDAFNTTKQHEQGSALWHEQGELSWIVEEFEYHFK